MTIAQKQRFPARATLAYAVLASCWIIFSDRLLAALADAATMVWLSQAKGLAFVAATAIFLYLALQAVVADSAANDAAAAARRPANPRGFPFCRGCLPIYAFSVASSAFMLSLHTGVDLASGEPPMLILLTFPILISALLGGVGPGLTATATGALGINYLGMAPLGDWRIESPLDQFQIVALLLNGVLVSVLSESLHRSRNLAEAHREAALANEQRLRLAQDAARAGTWEWTLESGANYWSPEIWRLYGIAAESVRPGYQAWKESVHPDDRDAVCSLVDAASRAGEEFETEWRINRPAGEAPRWLMCRGRPLKNADGRIDRYIGIVIDITRHKLAEDELEGSRRLLEKRVAARTSELLVSNRALIEQQALIEDLYNHAPCGYHSLDTTGKVVSINDTELSWLGVTRAEAIGTHFSTFVAPSSHAGFADNFSRFLATGHVDGIEIELLRKDGGTLPVVLSATAVRDGAGRLLRSRTTLFDITERKLAERETRIAAIAFDTRDGMIVTDARGRILQANRAFRSLSGYAADELIGQTPALLRSGQHDDNFYRAMWEAVSREGHWQGLVSNRRKDGAVVSHWLSISAIKDRDERISHYVGEYSDASEPREAERKLRELAFYDPLTGLPNRRLLVDRLTQAGAACARSGKFGALLLIDGDHFKSINDTRDHRTGDAVLVEMAHRLRATLRETDTAARLSADEFLVILEGIGQEGATAAATAGAVANKLRAALGEPYVVAEQNLHLSVSIGITLFDHTAPSADELQKQADLALYKAKTEGRDTWRFFNPEMQAAANSRALVEAGLRRGLGQGEFVLHYQPQVDWQGRLIGAEALLRWQPPGQKTVSPAIFIPVAEECGLIVPIGRWVLTTACRQIADWAKNPATRQLKVAVNISAHQFRQPDFARQVDAALCDSGADPAQLKLEVTESAVIDDMDQVIKTMQEIRALGVAFSMDDFGTGYSSLANLKRLPIEQLKIDQSFVRDIPADQDDCAIARAVVAMGRSLHLHVIAEGVETEAQREFLASHGCLAYQGYLFGRPGPAAAIDALAAAGTAS